jgi:two-component system OmpR family sensor kinase
LSLRLRLVVALVALLAAGLSAFFFGTYSLYRSSQYQNLDNQLRSSEPLIDQELDAAAGAEAGGGFGGQGNGPGTGQGPPSNPGGGPSSPVLVPIGTYAELISASGTVLSHVVQISDTAARPKLPTPLPAPTAQGRIFTVGATSGSSNYRILEDPARDGGTTVIAIPTTEMENALHRLVLIELSAGAALVAALSAGAWFIIRRGLNPLERMARTATLISSGDLSQRVSPADGATEVGQLGMALNTMLTDIEQAFAQREATERRLRQFLADASHELRTPLTSIRGFAELFRVTGTQARVDLPTILRRIEQESDRMRDLVEDLLLLARLDEQPEPHLATVDLTVLAADACSDAVATDRQRNITLHAPTPVAALADEAHLRQAIANLVTNAIRHTPEGTPIDVTVGVSDGYAEMSVRDHGAGLDPESLEQVFDRFWQADKARSGSGSGLGLSIVAAIAREHHGTIRAANADSGGAIFTMRLPINPVGQPPEDL